MSIGTLRQFPDSPTGVPGGGADAIDAHVACAAAMGAQAVTSAQAMLLEWGLTQAEAQQLLAADAQLAPILLKLFSSPTPLLSVTAGAGPTAFELRCASVEACDVIQVAQALAPVAPQIALDLIIACLEESPDAAPLAEACVKLLKSCPGAKLAAWQSQPLAARLHFLLAASTISLEDKLSWRPWLGDSSKATAPSIAELASPPATAPCDWSARAHDIARVFYAALVQDDLVKATQAMHALQKCQGSTSAALALRCATDMERFESTPSPERSHSSWLPWLFQAISANDAGKVKLYQALAPCEPGDPQVVGQAAALAISVQAPEALAALLQAHPESINEPGPDGFTPLSLAAAMGHTDMVRILLLDPDLKPDLKDDRGKTALGRAAKNGHVQVAALLLGICDINKRDSWGKSALHLAAANNHTDVAALLLKHPKISPGKVDQKGRTPLHGAAKAGH